MDKDLNVAGRELSAPTLGSILQHVFAHKRNQLLGEVAFDLVVVRSVEGARGRIRRMNIKSPIRLLLHMKSELQLACVRGKFQARKIGAQAGKNCGLNFFLELFAGSGFEGRNVGIAGASREGDLTRPASIAASATRTLLAFFPK